MLQTKPDQILRSLTQYEINRLDKFISGATGDERLVKAWEYVRAFYKERIPEALDKENIWSEVFGKEKFVALKYARLLSDLTKVIEKFLLLEYLQVNEVDKTIALMQIYNNRSLGAWVLPLAKEGHEIVEKLPYRDGDYYLSRYLIDEQHNHFIENLDRRDSEKHLNETMHSLDVYYVIQKLKFFATALHYQKFLNIPAEIQFMEEVLRFAETKAFDKVIMVRAYIAIIQTLQEQDGPAAFERLRVLLNEHINMFPKSEAEQLYAFAVNYCIRMINKGDLDYVQKIFTLYKQMLKDELLTYTGSLSPWEFKNIVTIALRAKELKWAAQFIDKYSSFIPARDRDNAYTFNMARYAFAAGKYDKVLELLGSVEYDDVFYQLDAKATLMKTYFEMGEFQPLQSLKESFRILLSRTKLISETQQNVYGNFVRYTLKLFRVDVKDKKKVAALKAEIEKTKQIADKGWLMEKLKDLGA